MRTTCFVALVLASTGCAPTMPTAFGESTDVLSANQVSVTAIGGGGAVVGTCNGCSGSVNGFGGEARVRYGLGHQQEIGLSGYGGALVSFGSSTTSIGVGGGEVSYKAAPERWIAIVAGLGFNDLNGTVGVAGDAGALVAKHLDDLTSVYSGARFSFAVYPPPSGGNAGSAEAVTIPIGVSIGASEMVHVIVEGGFLLGWEQLGDGLNSDAVLGGYGTLGLQLVFGGAK